MMLLFTVYWVVGVLLSSLSYILWDGVVDSEILDNIEKSKFLKGRLDTSFFLGLLWPFVAVLIIYESIKREG